MLDELKNLRYQGGKDVILFFLCDVIGNKKIKVNDAEVICSHAYGKRFLSVKDLIRYCSAFGWIYLDNEYVNLSPFLTSSVNEKDALNKELILSEVELLFKCNAFSPSMFSYDSIRGCYSFKNELLSLSFSEIRNVLISQGFFIVNRIEQGTRFYISPSYDSLIARHCKAKRKQLSLEKLKKQLQDNELAGEKAELFVLSFEKERVGQPLCDSIKRISEIDTSAGYDIVSYNSRTSLEPDRFIEVKAVSKTGFYWTRNEYEVAKLKGEAYFLYLVELARINEQGYVPEIIQNPAVHIINSEKWYLEAQSYLVKRA